MRAVLTPEDLKRGDLVEPGWYPVEYFEYDEKEASTDKSANCFFKVRVIDGRNNGVSPRVMFNEKALGFGKNLWRTLNFPFDSNKGFELSSELFRAAVGARFQVYIKRGKSDRGNEFNEVVDFRPLDGSALPPLPEKTN